MDFPTEVDCIICGTGLTESIVSASLSILGKRVLHIDQNDYYGGRLASLRFPDFCNIISENATGHSETNVHMTSSSHCLKIEKPFSYPITNASFHWHLQEDDECSKAPTTDLVHQSAATILDESADTTQFGSAAMDENAKANISNTVDDRSKWLAPAETEVSAEKLSWNRASLEKRLTRVDLDLLPKIIYAESPTVTALLRADVTRYLEFRFISRLLALTIPPSPDSANSGSTINSHAQVHVSGGYSTFGEEFVKNTQLIQIPVCRSDVFKTRLLTLRQKRALGSFFEWCYDLPIDTSPASEESIPDIQIYNAYASRPLRDLLTEHRNLDSFTQQLVINNLAFGSDEIITKEAILRIRQLLLSMNRFGPYPLLWPMYGCGDLPQGYCRMSAVFGAVFCLDCSLTSIKCCEAQSGDAKSPTEFANTSNIPPNFLVRLSNGHEVRTRCILIGAEQAPRAWIQPNIHRWCARAILLTDRSLHEKGRKATDISMLALPLSGRGGNELDPAVLLEIPVDPLHKSDPELFIVHIMATVCVAVSPELLFRPIIERLFCELPMAPKYERSSLAPSECTDLRPKLLWTSYFCLPDLSVVQWTVPKASVSDGSRFTNANGLYVVPGPDFSVNLDSTAITAETIFHEVAGQLGIRSTQQARLQQPTAAGNSDGPSLSNLTTANEVPSIVAEQTPYMSLDARWDGLFPPRPPRPEDIVVQSDTEFGEELDVRNE